MLPASKLGSPTATGVSGSHPSVSEEPTGETLEPAATFEIVTPRTIIPRTTPLALALAQRDADLDGAPSASLDAVAQRMTHCALAIQDEVRRNMETWLAGGAGGILNNLEHLVPLSDLVAYTAGVARPRTVSFNVTDVPHVGTIKGLEQYPMRGFSLVGSERDNVVVEGINEQGLEILLESRRMAGLSNGRVISPNDLVVEREAVLAETNYMQFFRTQGNPDRRSFALQELLDNKNVALRFLRRQGVAVPSTWFAGRADACRPNLIKEYPVFAKIVRSAGGQGVTRCDDVHALRLALDRASPEDEVQVQQGICGRDVSKQYFASENGVVAVTNTDQVIRNGVEHAGNVVFSTLMDDDDNRNADRAARAIQRLGYRGFFAVDLIKPDHGGLAKVIEINPRMGGVTAPTFVATHAGFGEFLNQQYTFPNLASLREAVNRFGLRQGGGAGFVPITVIPLPSGRVKAELVTVSDRGGRDVAAVLERFIERQQPAAPTAYSLPGA